MPRIQLLLAKGENVLLKSPSLTDEEVTEQLDIVEKWFSETGPLSLPWVRVAARGVVAAQKIRE